MEFIFKALRWIDVIVDPPVLPVAAMVLNRWLRIEISFTSARWCWWYICQHFSTHLLIKKWFEMKLGNQFIISV
jgi:hypothetical protein